MRVPQGSEIGHENVVYGLSESEIEGYLSVSIVLGYFCSEKSSNAGLCLVN